MGSAMGDPRLHWCASLAVVTCLVGCGGGRPHVADGAGAALATAQRTSNLRAFARLYGYLKYFHPSDEAAAADWKALAVYGAGVVASARDRRELAGALRDVFQPIAPTLQIREGPTPPANHPALDPGSTRGLVPVAWQHEGDGVDRARGGVYSSVRTHRLGPPERAPSGCAYRELDSAAVVGKRVTVQAWLRGNPVPSSSVRLLAYASGDDWSDPGSQHFGDGLAISATWQRHDYARTLAADEPLLYVGVCLYNAGRVEIDDLQVTFDDGHRSIPVEVDNPGFESGAGPSDDGGAFDIGTFAEAPHGGKLAAFVELRQGLIPGSLFAGHPEVGEVARVDLGAGLYGYVPLALWSKDDHTLPLGDPAGLAATLAAVDTEDVGRLEVRLGAVVVAWNVIQHFFPYFDVIDADWPAELDRALDRALDDRTAAGFVLALQMLLEPLVDAHAHVRHERLLPRDGTLPFASEWIEDRLVVTISEDQRVQVGDVITAIDGRPTEAWRRALLPTISGSAHHKRWYLPRLLARGAAGSVVKLTLSAADGSVRTAAIERTKREDDGVKRQGSAVRPFEDGVFYVDLDRAGWDEIEARLEEVAAAPGVVFDLRGYPRNNHEVLRHLLSRPDTADWMFVPQLVLPERQPPVRWRAFGWDLTPATPRIRGRVAFLTDGRAQSYAESVLGFVDGYELGALVGEPTTGVNGNVNPVELPGGFTLYWTGMKVLRHDGSRLYGIGIPPTHPATRTIDGVRAGRDEVLERGLAIVRGLPPLD